MKIVLLIQRNWMNHNLILAGTVTVLKHVYTVYEKTEISSLMPLVRGYFLYLVVLM